MVSGPEKINDIRKSSTEQLSSLDASAYVCSFSRSWYDTLSATNVAYTDGLYYESFH